MAWHNQVEVQMGISEVLRVYGNLRDKVNSYMDIHMQNKGDISAPLLAALVEFQTDLNPVMTTYFTPEAGRRGFFKKMLDSLNDAIKTLGSYVVSHQDMIEIMEELLAFLDPLIDSKSYQDSYVTMINYSLDKKYVKKNAPKIVSMIRKLRTDASVTTLVRGDKLIQTRDDGLCRILKVIEEPLDTAQEVYCEVLIDAIFSKEPNEGVIVAARDLPKYGLLGAFASGKEYDMLMRYIASLNTLTL